MNNRNRKMIQMMSNNNGRFYTREDGQEMDEQNYRKEPPRDRYGRSEMEMYGAAYDAYDRMGDYEMENRHRGRNGRFVKNEYEPMGVNPIGFENRYEMEDRYARMGGGGKQQKMMRGGAMSEGMKLEREDAEEWVEMMENADGSTGGHWTMEQAKQILKQSGEKEMDPVEFYAALNATYSDLCKFFRKYEINNMAAYVDFVKAFWFEDEDAPDKVSKYYFGVVCDE